MGILDEIKNKLDSINNGNTYKGGDAVQPSTINDVVEASKQVVDAMNRRANIVDGEAENSATIGIPNTNLIKNGFICGSNNKGNDCDNSAIIGYNNRLTQSDSCFVSGQENNLWVSSGCAVLGSYNDISGDYLKLLGNSNKVEHDSVKMVGHGLTSHKDRQILLGQFNAESNADIVIGNGDKDNRRNAMEVSTDENGISVLKVGGVDIAKEIKENPLVCYGIIGFESGDLENGYYDFHFKEDGTILYYGDLEYINYPPINKGMIVKDRLENLLFNREPRKNEKFTFNGYDTRRTFIIRGIVNSVETIDEEVFVTYTIERFVLVNNNWCSGEIGLKLDNIIGEQNSIIGIYGAKINENQLDEILEIQNSFIGGIEQWQ